MFNPLHIYVLQVVTRTQFAQTLVTLAAQVPGFGLRDIVQSLTVDPKHPCKHDSCSYPAFWAQRQQVRLTQDRSSCCLAQRNHGLLMLKLSYSIDLCHMIGYGVLWLAVCIVMAGFGCTRSRLGCAPGNDGAESKRAAAYNFAAGESTTLLCVCSYWNCGK